MGDIICGSAAVSASFHETFGIQTIAIHSTTSAVKYHDLTG
jgi:hypothetical protein